jgi:hypothetical protein
MAAMNRNGSSIFTGRSSPCGEILSGGRHAGRQRITHRWPENDRFALKPQGRTRSERRSADVRLPQRLWRAGMAGSWRVLAVIHRIFVNRRADPGRGEPSHGFSRATRGNLCFATQKVARSGTRLSSAGRAPMVIAELQQTKGTPLKTTLFFARIRR